MDYNHITSFLDKFKKLIYQKEETKEIIAKIISEEIHHTFEKTNLKIKGVFVYIQASPILRSEILVHKKQILEKIKLFLPDNNFTDIR